MSFFDEDWRRSVLVKPKVNPGSSFSLLSALSLPFSLRSTAKSRIPGFFPRGGFMDLEHLGELEMPQMWK